MLIRLDTVPALDGRTGGQTDRQTDGQTELVKQYRALHALHG